MKTTITIPVLIRRNGEQLICKIVAPDLIFKLHERSRESKTILPESKTPSSLPMNRLSCHLAENGSSIDEKARAIISSELKNRLDENIRMAVSLVPAKKETWDKMIVKDEQGAKHEWMEIEVEVEINNKCLSVSSQLLPGIVMLAFLADVGFDIYLEIITTQVSADIVLWEAIASTAYDVMQACVTYIVSQTTQNMIFLNKKFLGCLSSYDNGASSYRVAEDFVVTSRCNETISRLKSPRFYLFLLLGGVVVALAGHNFYVGAKADYNINMGLLDKAVNQHLTSLSLATLHALYRAGFSIGIAVNFLVTSGTLLRAVNESDTVIKQVQSYLVPLTNRLSFFSCCKKNNATTENTPLLHSTEEKSMPPHHAMQIDRQQQRSCCVLM
jgi:hypothetical protein